MVEGEGGEAYRGRKSGAAFVDKEGAE